MNTLEIREYLMKNIFTRDYFLGVYAANRLPRHNFKRPALIVANLDDDSKQGLILLKLIYMLIIIDATLKVHIG